MKIMVQLSGLPLILIASQIKNGYIFFTKSLSHKNLIVTSMLTIGLSADMP